MNTKRSIRSSTRFLRRFGLGLLAVGWLLVPSLPATEEFVRPGLARLQADVSFLAADELEGRATGSEGIRKAADYIAETFEEAGLTTAPGAEGFFQPFELTGAPRLGRTQRIEVALEGTDEPIEARMRRDFMPLAIGGDGELEGLPIVFVGYGITAGSEQENGEPGFEYDDYADVDVEGKVVLMLRRAPGYSSATGPFAPQHGMPSRHATFQRKAVNAFQHGAAAVLLVNDLEGLEGAKDELLRFTDAGLERYTTIPFVMVTRAFADRLLEAAGAPSLKALEAEILGREPVVPASEDAEEEEGDDEDEDEEDAEEEDTQPSPEVDPKPVSRELEGVTLSGTISVEHPTIIARNVVGVLEGAGPHADETIIIGAHYDHLGNGGMGSLAPFSREIHNGADDNASGTAMIMELARRLASRSDPLPRRVVFIAFSGEERGLLGSRHYVEDPLYPLDQTVAMLNFDMVGRLNDEDELTVFGVESTPGLRDLVEALGASQGFNIKANARVAGNSDHAPFFEEGVPVAFFFTGTHKDYHRPSDDVEFVNFEGMARIANMAELVLLDFARRPERPEFTRTAAAEPPQRGVSGISVSLGTIPDYDESVEGVRLNGVREDSAADKAGLQKGDIIIGFGGKPVGTIYDFMEGLGRYDPGDKVEIKVKRGEETVRLEATLDPARSVRNPHGDE